MKNLGYYNGKYDEIEKMQIPMLDRVCWFGDGVYDATYAHNHIVFDMDAHLTRFYNSAKLLGMNIPIERDELDKLLRELVKKVDDGDQFVYMQVTRGNGLRGHIILKICRAICGLHLRLALLRIHISRLMLLHMRTKDFIIAIAKHLILFRLALPLPLLTEQVAKKQFSTEEILLRNAHTLMFLFLRTVRLLLTSLTIWFFREQQG